jgi:hypothetical protein
MQPAGFSLITKERKHETNNAIEELFRLFALSFFRDEKYVAIYSPGC